jgi:hypothetical protein
MVECLHSIQEALGLTPQHYEKKNQNQINKQAKIETIANFELTGYL